MFIKKGQNCNVYIDSARIPMFGRRSSEFPCLRLEFKCLSKTQEEFYYLDTEDQNSNICKNKIRIPILLVIGLGYQSVKE